MIRWEWLGDMLRTNVLRCNVECAPVRLDLVAAGDSTVLKHFISQEHACNCISG